MTTAIATDLTTATSSGHQHFLLRRLHSLTGIFFGGYLIVHLIVNATLIQGTNPDFFQSHVDKIHAIPFLTVVEWAFIYLPILFHAAYGLWILISAKWNIANYPFERNWAYVGQRISALILVAFILFHILGMKGLFGSAMAFDPEHATNTVVKSINASWMVAFVIYPIGILASAYHTANGFCTAGVTWGLTVTADSQRWWGRMCAGLGALMLVCGLVALFASIHDASHLSTAVTNLTRH